MIQSFIEQLPLVVKQCLFHASNKNDHMQLRPEAVIRLQFLSWLGDVTSWNIRLYRHPRGNIKLFTEQIENSLSHAIAP